MELIVVLFLMFLGLTMFWLELFVFQGTTWAGVAGAMCVGGAMWYAFKEMGFLFGFLVLTGIIVLYTTLLWLSMRTRLFDKFLKRRQRRGNTKQNRH